MDPHLLNVLSILLAIGQGFAALVFGAMAGARSNASRRHSTLAASRRHAMHAGAYAAAALLFALAAIF